MPTLSIIVNELCITPVKPSPNQDDAEPIVRRPTELLITARDRTRVCSVSLVTPLALRCSALDGCATREPEHNSAPLTPIQVLRSVYVGLCH